jgi:peptidoglycan DL-endopeptidase CwlO
LETKGTGRNLVGMHVVKLHNIALLVSSGLFVLTSIGCTPKAGHIRFQHPGLQEDSGRTKSFGPGVPGTWFKGTSPEYSPAANRLRQQVARSAAQVVGQQQVKVSGKSYRRDCSGVVRGIYADAGVPLRGSALSKEENDVSIIYRWVNETGSLRKSHPLPGDLVFFDDTYDRNRDRKENDPLSHVGVVEEVMPDGTVTFVHHVGGGILRYRLNLDDPHTTRNPKTGDRLNHVLRRQNGNIEMATTAELFVAFGTIIINEQSYLAHR